MSDTTPLSLASAAPALIGAASYREETKRKLDDRDDAIVDAWDRKRPIDEIARTYGLRETAVSAILRQHGRSADTGKITRPTKVRATHSFVPGIDTQHKDFRLSSDALLASLLRYFVRRDRLPETLPFHEFKAQCQRLGVDMHARIDGIVGGSPA